MCFSIIDIKKLGVFLSAFFVKITMIIVEFVIIYLTPI